ncbi:MAG: hypothetical protein A2Y10_00920 [Planctomycetes bacterium GWF2_41_51]|nr:MAG: hypothetical protein A2Y10_00920 [Planctomycetes bacterium GWF2_41_51]HBG26506.1 hypothetical protein [Phycisphaerales bacterium]
MKAALKLMNIVLCIGMYAISDLSKAEMIYIGIEANITGVDDPWGYFDGKINVDDRIKGYYSYNTATSPYYLDSIEAEYAFSYPFGIYLEAGEFNFQTNPNLGGLDLSIGNNQSISEYDYYSVHSFNNLQIFDCYYEIHWQLRDDTGTAISNLELPTIAPVLDNWKSENYFVISGLDSFNIFARVTKAELIPEPGTMMLIILGAALLGRKR